MGRTTAAASGAAERPRRFTHLLVYCQRIISMLVQTVLTFLIRLPLNKRDGFLLSWPYKHIGSTTRGLMAAVKYWKCHWREAINYSGKHWALWGLEPTKTWGRGAFLAIKGLRSWRHFLNFFQSQKWGAENSLCISGQTLMRRLCLACMDQLGFVWSTDSLWESMIHDAYKDAG